MTAKTYRFGYTPHNYKILAIKGVRTATNLGLKEAKDLVDAAVHNGVVLSFTQAYAINAGLEFVEFEKNMDRPSYDQVKAPRLIVVDQPLDLSESF